MNYILSSLFFIIIISRSNTHGVSLQVIERMKERYQRNITVESLMAMLTPSAARKNQNNSSEADPPIPSPRNQADRENTPTPQPRKDLPPHSRRPSIDKVESSLGDLYFDCNYKIAVGGEEASAVGQTVSCCFLFYSFFLVEFVLPNSKLVCLCFR